MKSQAEQYGCFHSCLLFLLCLSSVSSLILPLTKSSGEPDMSSIISHMTLMEQTMTSLQTQVQTTNSKLEATETELTIVKANLQTLTSLQTSLQTQVQTTNSKLHANEIELTAVKTNLQTTENELKVVKADLTTAKTDIVILKHDLQKGPDPVELTNIKSEFEALKNSLVQPSSDLRSNMREIQNFQARQNTTEKDLTTTMSLIQSTVSDVKTVQTHVNTVSSDVNSLSQQVSAMKSQAVTDQSKQNITEQDLRATKASVQSTSAEVKSIKSQVNSNTADVNAVHQGLTAIRTRTDENVAFQVTQRGAGSSGWTTLKFDTVDCSTGGGYNKTSGMFNAPVSGTYIFWINVNFYSTGIAFAVRIYKGQQELAKGYYNKGNDHNQGVASTMTVTDLDKGDQVHFTTSRTSYSRYGGALLHAT